MSAVCKQTLFAGDVSNYPWRGLWVTGTDYLVNDCVEYAGSGYVCLVGHHSSALFSTDLGTGKWSVLVEGNATHTGDVTGATALTIAAKAVTLAKMNDLAQDTGIGRVTASTGVPETFALTAAGRALLDDANAAAQWATLGGDAQALAAAVKVGAIDDAEVAKAPVHHEVYQALAAKLDTAATSLAGKGFFLDEDDFVSNSAEKVPSQQSTKAFVAASMGMKMPNMLAVASPDASVAEKAKANYVCPQIDITQQVTSDEGAWTAKTGVTCTADTSTKREGTASAKFLIDAAAFVSGQIAYKNLLASKDLSQHDYLTWNVLSDVVINGDFYLQFHKSAGGNDLVEELPLYNNNANLWYKYPRVIAKATSGYSTIQSVGIRARSPTLTNGTGTFAGSPITLVPGLNTITCTVAGNCTVYMPVGWVGTAKGGTMTLTNSYVALPSHSSTTLTTSGAVGTILVTCARTGFCMLGNGNCTGAPVMLALGSNTIHVIWLGTLRIGLPTGWTGTAQSGANITIAGSPVTLASGTDTEITASGTNYNDFTITITAAPNINIWIDDIKQVYSATETIQAAIDAIRATQVEGGFVQLTGGDYVCEAAIKLYRWISLYGVNALMTNLQFTSATGNGIELTYGTSPARQCYGVQIRDLDLWSINSSTGVGIISDTNTVGDIFIERCYVCYFLVGISLNNAINCYVGLTRVIGQGAAVANGIGVKSGTTSCNGVTIKQCYLSSVYYGVYMGAVCTTLLILGSIFELNTYGIYIVEGDVCIVGCYFGLISTNYIYDNAGTSPIFVAGCKFFWGVNTDDDPGDKITLGTTAETFATMFIGSQIHIPAIAASDPSMKGYLYNSSGTIKRSA
jgi:hypothetical protein